MKLKVSTILMRNFVAKLIGNAIRKKFGYKIDFQINKLNIEMVDGKAHLHADIEAITDNSEIMNMLKNISF